MWAVIYELVFKLCFSIKSFPHISSSSAKDIFGKYGKEYFSSLSKAKQTGKHIYKSFILKSNKYIPAKITITYKLENREYFYATSIELKECDNA